MIVQLLVRDEAGNMMPLDLKNVTQIVVRNGVTTPILALAADYGTGRSQVVAKAGDDDFHSVLRRLGIRDTTEVVYLQLPEPESGARLVAGPNNNVDTDGD